MILSFDGASASDFSDRLAAWQGGGPAAPRSASAAAYAEPLPPNGAAVQSSERALSSSYATPANQPQYGHAAGGFPAGHGPPFVPPADVFGACDMWGGTGWRGGSPACGDSCGPGGCFGNEAPWCTNTLVWAKFELLLWWRQGRDLPPLVTTDPVTESSTTAGILPDATILFGGDRVGTEMQAGGRFDIGTWTDMRQCCGIGWRFFGLGKDASEFNITSLSNPVLAIPFFDVANDQEEALLVAFPGLRTGEIHVASSSTVVGNDVYGRFLLSRGAYSRLDFLTGWHFSRINDAVEIRASSTTTEVGGNIPVGTVTDVRDNFDARNEFHGGILGLLYERDCGCWTTNVLARMSIGNMHERMLISGSTRVAVPNQTPVVTEGGLFTTESNIGEFARNEFTAVTEVGFTLGYRFAPCTQLTIGYSFIYWNDVLSPGDAINRNIGAGDEDEGQFAFTHSDYWVQGLNLGIRWDF